MKDDSQVDNTVTDTGTDTTRCWICDSVMCGYLMSGHTIRGRVSELVPAVAVCPARLSPLSVPSSTGQATTFQNFVLFVLLPIV